MHLSWFSSITATIFRQKILFVPEHLNRMHLFGPEHPNSLLHTHLYYPAGFGYIVPNTETVFGYTGLNIIDMFGHEHPSIVNLFGPKHPNEVNLFEPECSFITGTLTRSQARKFSPKWQKYKK